MTFTPALPVAFLVLLGLLILALRVFALRGNSSGLVRWGLLTAALLLLVLAAARPAVTVEDPDAQLPRNETDLNVFFVVDRSVASRVEDFGEGMSRMAGMRRDMLALIDRYPDARFGVISFGPSSDLDWPLSEDVWSLKSRISGMPPYNSTLPNPLPEINPVGGADILRYEVEQAVRQFPRSRNVVFYFGSGVGDPRPPDTRFSPQSLSGGAVLGYGSPAGGPVPRDIVDGQTVFVTDPARSGIDEPELTAIAEQLRVPYVRRDSAQPVTAAVPDLDSGLAPADVAAPTRHIELYWVFALVAAVLLLPESYLTVRQFRRNRVATT